jgi:tetratricopeptide (TPR) repeat protein
MIGYPELIALIPLLAGTKILLIDPLNRRFLKPRSYYKVVWREPSKLKPSEVLGLRADPEYGFVERFYPRNDNTHELIREKIEGEKKENVLIIGTPLSGKTRAIYQALITLKKPYDVIIPKVTDIDPKDHLFPYRLNFLKLIFWKLAFWRKEKRRKTILLLDDLEKFTEKKNFTTLLQKFLDRNIVIVASCLSGPEYKKLQEEMGKFSEIFKDPIKVPKISKGEGKKVAEDLGKSLPKRFDGNIGSIFLPLDAMRDRFRNCNDIEKGILRSIKHLYLAGIYREREIFSIDRVKLVSKEKKGIEREPFEWEELLKRSENKGFIEKINNDELQVEEAYLENVIENDIPPLSNFNDMIKIFSNDLEALFRIGTHAFFTRTMDNEKAKYVEISNQAWNKLLKINPEDAVAWSNKGLALGNLGRYEEALECFDKALEINPEKAEAWSDKGAALLHFGRFEEALNYFNKGLEISPDNGNLWYKKACGESLLGDVNGALSSLKRTVELDEKYKEMARTDKDFKNLRDDDRFKEIVEG